MLKIPCRCCGSPTYPNEKCPDCGAVTWRQLAPIEQQTKHLIFGDPIDLDAFKNCGTPDPRTIMPPKNADRHILEALHRIESDKKLLDRSRQQIEENFDMIEPYYGLNVLGGLKRIRDDDNAETK